MVPSWSFPGTALLPHPPPRQTLSIWLHFFRVLRLIYCANLGYVQLLTETAAKDRANPPVLKRIFGLNLKGRG